MTIKMLRALRLQTRYGGGDNEGMAKDRQPKASRSGSAQGNPFRAGGMVTVTLGNPRDKFWGMILALAPEGLSISGIELASFEDFVLIVKDGEQYTPAVVFLPMHRIERIELDLPDGALPSLSERFVAKTGLEATAVLTPALRKMQEPAAAKRASEVTP